MRSKTSRKWSDKDDQYIKDHVLDGTVKLASHFGVSLGAFRKRLFILGISMKLNKAELPTVVREPKADNTEKFCNSRHKIKNSSVIGKIPFKIESERITVYLEPEKDTPEYRQAIINKYANRHKQF